MGASRRPERLLWMEQLAEAMRLRRRAEPTLADHARNGARAVDLECLADGCRHRAVVPIDEFVARAGAATPLSALHGAAVCSRCGSRDVVVQPAMIGALDMPDQINEK